MGFDETMAILYKGTGSHFDPDVMAAFRSIARKTFDRLSNTNEAEARILMEERVRVHFGM
jgi:HD-GYP domain-containing protein (c-di-GMP phosphodiesterase class II)